MDTAIQYYSVGWCETRKTALLCLKVANFDPIFLLLKSVVR